MTRSCTDNIKNIITSHNKEITDFYSKEKRKVKHAIVGIKAIVHQTINIKNIKIDRQNCL